MDIVRAKSSAGDFCSSVHSYAFSAEPASSRGHPRHSYTTAEFNKFKSRLLKNHSRNYYAYDSVNLNNEFLKNSGELKDEQQKSLLSQPGLFQQGHSLAAASDSADISHKPDRQLSQIKSIYETIQRANNSRIFSLDMRRSNYLNSLRNTDNVLTSSLLIQKMSQRT